MFKTAISFGSVCWGLVHLHSYCQIWFNGHAINIRSSGMEHGMREAAKYTCAQHTYKHYALAFNSLWLLNSILQTTVIYTVDIGYMVHVGTSKKLTIYQMLLWREGKHH